MLQNSSFIIVCHIVPKAFVKFCTFFGVFNQDQEQHSSIKPAKMWCGKLVVLFLGFGKIAFLQTLVLAYLKYSTVHNFLHRGAQTRDSC